MNIAAQTVRDHLDLALQFKLVEQVRAVIEASPLVRPHTPNGLPMRVRVSAAGELGWVGDGAYRYSPRDRWGNPWPPIPAEWVEIADRVAAKVSPRKVRWNSAIINWYAEDAALGMHQDLAEDDHTSPIVTISLGDAASWAVQLGEDGPVHRTRIESGDVTLLCVEDGTRLARHSVERIIACPMFRPGTKPGRISITLRDAGDPARRR